ncbi:MAG: aminopeptidase P family protein [Bacteroidales bacterium]
MSELLPEGSLAVVLSADQQTRNGDQHYLYRQNSNLFYLTGINLPGAVLVLCPHHPDPGLREVLFIEQPDPVKETWFGKMLTKQEASAVSGVNTIKWLNELDAVLRDMILRSASIWLEFNEYAKYSTELHYRQHRFAKQIMEWYPAHSLQRLTPLITQLRVVKSDEEIELLRKACQITGEAFQRILGFVKPGIMEYEAEAEITHEFLRKGVRNHAYAPIIASGRNALILHYIENNRRMNEGDLLLLDFGAEVNYYAADLSRTLPVNGKFSRRQRACYDAVLRVQKAATELFVPGNTIDKVNKEVWMMMEEEMIQLGLFTRQEVKSQDPSSPLVNKYLMHGVSHFLGLDVHDVGDKYLPFEPGMVLTLEPGIYIPEENIGIRIENDIVVGDPPEDLMKSIPREAEEIESIMQSGR